MTDTEYAWAAGFIEADGCIHLSAQGNTRVEVIVVQKDRRPLDRLQRVFGTAQTVGIVTRRNGEAKYYRITFCGKNAEHVLMSILPYLDHKREIAQMGLQLITTIQSYRVDHPGASPVSSQERAKRLDLVRLSRVMSGDAERLSEVAPAEDVG